MSTTFVCSLRRQKIKALANSMHYSAQKHYFESPQKVHCKSLIPNRFAIIIFKTEIYKRYISYDSNLNFLKEDLHCHLI